jgi:hypothetical protein
MSTFSVWEIRDRETTINLQGQVEGRKGQALAFVSAKLS